MIALALLLAATPTKIVFTTAAGTVGTGACSPVVTVQSQDAAGNPTAPDASWTVLLSGAAAYFPASGCSGVALDPQGSLQLAPNAPSVSFRFLVPDPGSITLNANAASLPASQTWTVTPAPGEPVTLAFTGAAPALESGACSPALPLQIQDVNGAAATLDRAFDVEIGPTGYFETYGDPACAGDRVFSLHFAPGGAPTGTVYVRTPLGGQLTLEATSPGLHTGSLHLTVTAPASGGCTSAAGGGLWALLAAFAFAARRRA